MIYFDNNATTRIAPEVRAAIEPFLDEQYANPSSPHSAARRTSVALRGAREQVAGLLGVIPDEVVFTSGGTESINTAFQAACLLQPERRHIVVSTVEHPATLQCAARLEQAGYRVTRVPVDEAGRIAMDAYARSLTDDTALVSVMAANNETGVLFPVDELAGQAAERGILFHCDATQAVGKIPFRADRTGISFVSVSGHKMHAPKGIGALIVRRPINAPPLLVGGGQEQGRRAGTENVIGIVGMGAAAVLAQDVPAFLEQHVRFLRDEMESRVIASVERTRIAGAESSRLPNTSLLLFADVPAEVVLARLDMKGFCCSSGSACAAGATEPSHVLTAMQIPVQYTVGAVRISLSRYTIANEVEALTRELATLVGEIRGAG